jgi:hypothetical protein
MLVLIVDDSKETKAARTILTNRGLEFEETTKTTLAYGPTYTPPTVLKSGKAFVGLEAIKLADLIDRL